MLAHLRILSIVTVSFVLVPMVSAQKQGSRRKLVVNGQAEVPVVEMNGRMYVDLGALAQSTNGSLAFHKDQIRLTLCRTRNTATSEANESEAARKTGLSQAFMRTSIEAIALMREWASPIAYAIRHGYPITEEWVANYREEARSGLQQASAAVSTDADRQAIQLLTSEFEAVNEWSNKLLDARKSLSAANYAVSENALQDDPLSQKIVTCARFLGTMLGSGEFEDDASCR